jgi:anti-sigma regulatory factor (Ser/Thr protein kinase)
MPCPAPEGTVVGTYAGTADRDGLQHCMDLAEQVCERIGASAEDAYAINLAVEEVCINVADHGYAGAEPGPIELEFRWSDAARPARLEIVVRDRAPFFDPAQAPPPDLDADLDARRVGGLGWFLIGTLMETIEHGARPGGGNELRMVRALGPKEDA